MENIHLLLLLCRSQWKSVNQAMKIIGSSHLDEEKPCLGSEAMAPREEFVLPLPELIPCVLRWMKASVLSKGCYREPQALLPGPRCHPSWRASVASLQAPGYHFSTGYSAFHIYTRPKLALHKDESRPQTSPYSLQMFCSVL